MSAEIPNSGTTLSLKTSPGKDKRLNASKSPSIFTFGDFRMERDFGQSTLSASSKDLQFGSFDTLETLKVDDFNRQETNYIKPSELTLNKKDPKTYAYFGSFYSELVVSFDHIIERFPYAILSYDKVNMTANTVIDYSQKVDEITKIKTSTFKIPLDNICNQGSVKLNSGGTVNNISSLATNTENYAIQLSGSSAMHDILSYSFSAGSHMEFTVANYVFNSNTSSSSDPIYIRPTKKKISEYKNTISTLENQLLYEEIFLIPDFELLDGTENEERFSWPKSIDGFNPDISGSKYTDYRDDLLDKASQIDDIKTNMILRTIVGDNFKELDTDSQIYKKIIQVHNHQFDQLKNYIDNIAYAHHITYNGMESVPPKFMFKLSQLLGWKLSDGFSEVDLFEYLTSDLDGNTESSHSHFNVEIWKRILINLNWLYKKKGTRDALIFIFKLLGAPDCLISLNEFVYDIQKTVQGNISSVNQASFKINPNGYINYDNQIVEFQEGGEGRGNGVKYIDQWRPEFEPLKRIDNIKIVTGDTSVNGSASIVNSKEISISLDPAKAIECDAFEWYKLSGTCWTWGSLAPNFSALTVPFFYTIDNCEFVQPEDIEDMTFEQYIDFVYRNSIDPRDRKTRAVGHTGFHYHTLRKIYLNYYLLSDPKSNQLTFKALDQFINLLEVQLQDYLTQLIPATTIVESEGVVYRNTTFNRQKYVYKEGIDRGSEFQVKLPVQPVDIIVPAEIGLTIDETIKNKIIPAEINLNIADELKDDIASHDIKTIVSDELSDSIPSFELLINIQPETTNTTIVGTHGVVPTLINTIGN